MKYLKQIFLVALIVISVTGISYAATTVLYPFGGGTGISQPGQGVIMSVGGNSPFVSSTSPTVASITATSTTATSTFSKAISVRVPSGISESFETIRTGEAYPRSYLNGFGDLYFGGLGTTPPPFHIGKDAVSSNIISLTNDVGPATILKTLSTANCTTAVGMNAESTFTGYIYEGSSTQNAEWPDWFHNNYCTNGDLNYGILLQKIGTGSYRPFITAYTDNAVTDSKGQIKNAQWYSILTPTAATGTNSGQSISGTGSVTIGSITLTGSGTNFGTSLQAGDSFAIGSIYATVLSVESPTSLTMNATSTITGSGLGINRLVRQIGQLGIRLTHRDPSANFQIGPGNAAASSTAFKLDPGYLLNSPESGAIENNGTHLYYTDQTQTRYQLDQQSGGGGGTDGNWAFFNNSGIRLATTSNQVVMGATATTSKAKLSVFGSDSTLDGVSASMQLTNTASGGSDWYLRSGATGNRTGAGGLSIANNSTYALDISSAGKVGIGSTTPSHLLSVGDYFGVDTGGLISLGYSPYQIYQENFGDIVIQTQNPGSYFPRSLISVISPPDNLSVNLHDQEAGIAFKQPVNGGCYDGFEYTCTQGIELGTQTYTKTTSNSLVSGNYLNVFKQGTGTTSPLVMSFEDKDINNFSAAIRPGFTVDPSGSFAVGLYASTTSNSPNRYDPTIALQVSSSTAPTIFAVDTAPRTHVFQVTSSGVASTTNLTISGLGVPAGSYIAVNGSGQVIATTSPSAGGDSASTTLLSDTNAWSGVNKFLNDALDASGRNISNGPTVTVSTTTATGDTTSLITALSMLPSTGGSIELTCGNFSISGGLHIDKSNVTIRGQGRCTTLQFNAGLGTDTGIDINDGVQRSSINISDLLVSQTGTAGTGTAINFTHFVLSHFINVDTTGTLIGYLATSTGTHYNTIEHPRVSVSGVGSYGIYIGNGTQSTAIDNEIHNPRVTGDTNTTSYYLNAHSTTCDNCDSETTPNIGMEVGDLCNDCKLDVYLEQNTTNLQFDGAAQGTIITGFIADADNNNIVGQDTTQGVTINARVQYQPMNVYLSGQDTTKYGFSVGTTTTTSNLFTLEATSSAAAFNLMRLINSNPTATSPTGIVGSNVGGNIDVWRIYGNPGTSFINSKFNISVANSSKNLVDRLTIDNVGNVGIGTTSPWAKLSVANSVSDAANKPLFTVASTTAGTATSTLFIVQANGDVGIGTSSPYAVLSVVGNAVADAFNAVNSLATSTFAGGITGPNSFTVVNRTGWVGIGTSTPASPFAIDGVTGLIAQFGTTASSEYVGMAVSGVPRAMFGYDAVTSNAVIQGSAVGSSKGIEFNVGNNTFGSGTAGVFSSAGNFGVGTTSPFAKVSITNSISDTANKPLLVIASTTGGTATSTLMTMLANGNLGIGTSTPYARLSVVGPAIAQLFNATDTNATSTFAGAVKANDYYAGDGSKGFTGTCTLLSITTITVVDGLITSCN